MIVILTDYAASTWYHIGNNDNPNDLASDRIGAAAFQNYEKKRLENLEFAWHFKN